MRSTSNIIIILLLLPVISTLLREIPATVEIVKFHVNDSALQRSIHAEVVAFAKTNQRHYTNLVVLCYQYNIF